MPPGWSVEQRQFPISGGTYSVYHGPAGLSAASLANAWRKHATEVTRPSRVKKPSLKAKENKEDEWDEEDEEASCSRDITEI